MFAVFCLLLLSINGVNGLLVFSSFKYSFLRSFVRLFIRLLNCLFIFSPFSQSVIPTLFHSRLKTSTFPQFLVARNCCKYLSDCPLHCRTIFHISHVQYYRVLVSFPFVNTQLLTECGRLVTECRVAVWSDVT